MKLQQLEEGLIKVPEKLFKNILHIAYSYVATCLTTFLNDQQLYHSEQEMELYFGDAYELLDYLEEKSPLPIITDLKISDSDDDLLVKKIPMGDELLRNYPEKEHKIKYIVCLFSQEKNNRQLGGFSGGFKSRDDALGVGLEFPKFTEFTQLPRGERLLLKDTFGIRSAIDNIYQIAKHELMHVVQVAYIKHPEQADRDYKDGAHHTEVSNYLASNVEFSPMLQSKIEIFKNKNLKNAYLTNVDNEEQLKDRIRTFVGMGPKAELHGDRFFVVLKSRKPNKYKKAVKILYDDVMSAFNELQNPTEDV